MKYYHLVYAFNACRSEQLQIGLNSSSFHLNEGHEEIAIMSNYNSEKMTIDEQKIFGLKCSLGAYLLVSSASIAVEDVTDPAFLVGLLNILIALMGIIAIDYTKNLYGAIVGGLGKSEIINKASYHF